MTGTGNPSTSTVFAGMLILAAVVLFLVFAYRREQEKQQALLALADRRGWTITGDGNPGWVSTFSCQPFNQGHSRQVGLELTGTDRGRAISVFDYRYYTTEHYTSTDSRGVTHHHTREVRHPFRVAVLRTGLTGPAVQVSGENWLQRAMDALTGSDIDFENETFNRTFRVTGDDRRFAYAVIIPQVMQLLLDTKPPLLAWEAGFLVAAARGEWEAAQIEPVLAVLQSLADLVPPYLLTDPAEDSTDPDGGGR